MSNLIIQGTSQIDVRELNIERLLQEFYASLDVSKQTIKTYRKGINNFIRWVRDNDIHTLDKKVMLRYKEYLIDTYEDTTASTYLSGVRNLFNFLEELGIPNIMRNIKGIPISKEFRKQPLSKQQAIKVKLGKEVKLITLKDYRDYAIYCLLLYNGLREIELHRANKTDIKRQGDKIIMRIQGKGKKGKTQIIVLTDSVLIPLLAYLDKRGKDKHDALFIGLASNQYGTRLTTDSIGRIIKKMFVENGYISRDLTAHSLRHTAITNVLKGGGDLQKAKVFARHSDINTTLIYSHNLDRIKDAPEYYVEKYLNSEDSE